MREFRLLQVAMDYLLGSQAKIACAGQNTVAQRHEAIENKTLCLRAPCLEKNANRVFRSSVQCARNFSVQFFFTRHVYLSVILLTHRCCKTINLNLTHTEDEQKKQPFSYLLFDGRSADDQLCPCTKQSR